MQTSDGREALYSRLGPLGQEYIKTLLSGDKKTDQVYGVYFNNEGTLLGDKPFDIVQYDNIIVDGGGVIYVGTPGLFELIFKRIPDDAIYTEDDKQTYKSILLATNAHRRGHNALLPVLGNKGYKYKNIIAPLLSTRSQQERWRCDDSSQYRVTREQTERYTTDHDRDQQRGRLCALG